MIGAMQDSGSSGSAPPTMTRISDQAAALYRRQYENTTPCDVLHSSDPADFCPRCYGYEVVNPWSAPAFFVMYDIEMPDGADDLCKVTLPVQARPAPGDLLVIKKSYFRVMEVRSRIDVYPRMEASWSVIARPLNRFEPDYHFLETPT